MAIHITIRHEADHDEDRILLVDALGVSGGDRCVELKRGETTELWLGRDGRISLRDKELEAS